MTADTYNLTIIKVGIQFYNLPSEALFVDVVVNLKPAGSVSEDPGIMLIP